MKKKSEELSLDRFSLIDLIRGFMEYATEHGNKKWFPPLNDPLWHDLVHASRTKAEDLGMQDAQRCMGEFDYDGDYPKIRGWTKVISDIRNECDQRTFDKKVALREGKQHKKRSLLLQEVVEMMLMVAERIRFFRE